MSLKSTESSWRWRHIKPLDVDVHSLLPPPNMTSSHLYFILKVRLRILKNIKHCKKSLGFFQKWFCCCCINSLIKQKCVWLIIYRVHTNNKCSSSINKLHIWILYVFVWCFSKVSILKRVLETEPQRSAHTDLLIRNKMSFLQVDAVNSFFSWEFSGRPFQQKQL